MTNAEIAGVLEDIADFLEIKGENRFKVVAYQKAARSIDHLPEPVENLVSDGKLTRKIPEVGESIAQKIAELVNTGRLSYYEELRSEFPPGVVTLLEIPGVGPRTALRLSQELKVGSIHELEQAIKEGKVAALHRMGDKTAENILKHIESLRRKEQRIPIGQALPVVERLIAGLHKSYPRLKNLTAAGSLRRFKETVGDIDLMGTADNAAEALEHFVRLPDVKEIIGRGETKASIVTREDLQVDLRVVEHDAFGSLLQYFTGSKTHNVKLREKFHKKGLKLSEYGITDLATGKLEKFATEEVFYARLGMQYIPPEIREGRNEIELAESGKLPRLVSVADIKGDFHAHTKWSDGVNTIEEMIDAARGLGCTFMTITDHSAGLGVAKGLDKERYGQQKQKIREVNAALSGFVVLSGAEVDIRADGALDFPAEVLKEMDVVIAAVHSGMGQDKEKMTARIIKAISNPCVDILAHPTCRLIGEREPVEVDLEAVFRAAAANGVAMEINAMPDRLDLKDVHIQRAREMGVKLALGTDSHRTEHLKLMRYGVETAMRGWCTPEDLLNCLPLDDLRSVLRRRRCA